METLIPLLIQLIGGGAGGQIVAKLLKNLDINKVLALITGVLGGVGGGQLAGVLDLLKTVFGDGQMGTILGNGGASAIGGALLTAIVGFIRKAMAGKA
jgi:hypothetical protein